MAVSGDAERGSGGGSGRSQARAVCPHPACTSSGRGEAIGWRWGERYAICCAVNKSEVLIPPHFMGGTVDGERRRCGVELTAGGRRPSRPDVYYGILR